MGRRRSIAYETALHNHSAVQTAIGTRDTLPGSHPAETAANIELRPPPMSNSPEQPTKQGFANSFASFPTIKNNTDQNRPART